jgi:hypothetical protein
VRACLVEVIGAWPRRVVRSAVRLVQRVSRPPAVMPDIRRSCCEYWRRSGHEVCCRLPGEICRVPRRR